MSNPTPPAASRSPSSPPSAGAFERHPPPYVECLQWSPRRFASGDGPRTRADIVFTQQVLKRIREHATAFPDHSVLGLLLGQVFLDPAGNRPWVRVEEALRTAQPLPEGSPSRELGAALEEAASRAAPGRLIVGWYRSHCSTGLFLTDEEARLQESRFPEPWQCAVVLLGTERQPSGGVFQVIEGEGLIRGLYTPFYELIDPSSELGRRECRTFAGWANYEPSGPVVLAGSPGVSAVLPSAPRGEAARDVESRARARPGQPQRPTQPQQPARPQQPTQPQQPARQEQPASQDQPSKQGQAIRPDQPQRGQPGQPARPVHEERPARRERPASAEPVRRETAARGERHVAPPEAAPTRRHEIIEPRSPPPPVLGTSAARPPIPSAGAPGSAGRPPKTRATGSDAVDSEEEWKRRQIQRSLTAVGRTLGPSGPGEPRPDSSRPAPTSPTGPSGTGAAGARGGSAAGSVGAESGAAAVPGERPHHRPRLRRPRRPERPVVKPPGEPLLVRPSMVGGARRRARVPVPKLGLAAIGLLALAGAGWAAVRLADGVAGSDAGTPPVADGGDAARPGPGHSAAAFSLRPGDLLGRGEGRARPGEEGSGSAAPGEPRDPGAPEGGESAGLASDGADPASEGTQTPGDRADATGGDPAATNTGPPDPATGRATENAVPTPPAAVDPDVRIDDLEVAAYENALGIFRKETVRYDDVRRAYDNGLEGCNALNLAYRGVQESFARLERRFADARRHFVGPALRAFESAERESAVVDRHYELTPCPPPVGG